MCEIKNMRRNGSRLISLKQYRLTDLFLFAVILVAFDLLSYFAPIIFSGAALYYFTLTVPIVLLVMIRWGWQAALFAIGDGIFQSVLYNPGVWQSYLSYAIGYAFILLLLIPIKFIGKQRISGKWFFSVLFAFSGWVLLNLGVSCMQAICGYNFTVQLSVNFGFGANGVISLAIAVILILVFRRLDGMFEDQKHYLKRMDKERRDLARRDEFGDEPVEIDEDSLSILKRDYEDS